MPANRYGWGRMATCADSYESEGRLFESAWAHPGQRVAFVGLPMIHVSCSRSRERSSGAGKPVIWSRLARVDGGESVATAPGPLACRRVDSHG